MFYNSKKGRISVYNSSYAGLLDFFAISNGLCITIISMLLYLDNFSIFYVLPLFIGGTAQALMHVAKFFVRSILH